MYLSEHWKLDQYQPWDEHIWITSRLSCPGAYTDFLFLFYKGGSFNSDAGHDAGILHSFSLIKRIWVNFPLYRVGLSLHTTDLSDKQASKKKSEWP